MVAKKPAKAKKPVAKKAEAKKPLPAKAKPASAKAPVKAKSVVPAPKAKVAALKPLVVKPAPKAVLPAKGVPAAKSAVAAPKAALVVKPAAKPVPAVKPAAKPAVVAPALPARPLRPGSGGAVMPFRTGLRYQTPSNDEEEVESSLSLLAGPRNVKPYLAKKGEQYMGKAQLEHFRTILRSWKRDLMEEVDRTVTHMKDEAANPPDPNDRATLESEFSLELRTRDRERKLIRKIDEALGRIEDGSYGYCLETGEEIGIKRLEARPVATLSIEAQERRERREKQYGDRDDRYR